MVKVNIDGTEYETDDMSDNAKAQLASLQFLQNHIQQIKNEIAVFETAKIQYANMLKAEFEGQTAG